MTKRSTWMLALCVAACAPAEGSKSADAEGQDERRQSSEKIAPQARAARVEVATLDESRASLELVLPGEVEGSREAMLASPMGGYVERVSAEVGDVVRAGHALASVNRAAFDVQLELAKVQLDQANSDLATVKRAGKSIAKSRRDAATFAAAAAEANFRLAQLNAKRAVVRAPFAGIVAERKVEQGEVLPPGGGVARLVKVDPVHISLSVSDQDVVNLKRDMAVKVTTDARGTQLDGTVYRVGPAASLNTRTFEVLVSVANKEGALRPGMIATVRTKAEISGGGISIPQYVLVTRLEGNGVFIDDGGVARWRPLKLGSLVRGQIVVASGLAIGDRLIVTGHRELVDGDKLLVAREGRCCVDGQIEFGGK